MKIYQALISIIIIVFLSSCSSKDNQPDAYGQFEATEIIISSEVQGKLIKWDVEEGKRYHANTLLGVIDTTSLYLKKQQLLAQLKTINAKFPNISTQLNVLNQQKKNLESEKERFTKLVKENAATQKQLDDIINNISVIEKQIENVKTQNQLVTGEIETLQYQIKQVDDQLQKCYIRMPLDGDVLEKYVEYSELVLPSKVLIKVADLNNIIFRCYVDEEQLSQIKLGNVAKVYVDNGNNLKEFQGKISWISSQAEFSPKIIQNRDERKNLVYAVKILLKNDGSLKIGMLGDVRFK
ncbi:MAG TPA: efflux RND transporter periplasmic adaptor subunit [Ignavibacteriales bacterium]|nr:efflux RND transporter periplasmic adaptor subunit [Ignavibacteriales bacterium]HOL80546.1 efflux RND transporter periplasmic adaptor subunit [Ignavibacteriales bacterium]HOM64235.1 efflux RND transporter periplasmic adaptor subunit [Ignavibacteriales bacterium]HPD67291.1 efflux RND transporter periplasmic adaptor subunit [Ignavibacteriales bacterium]HPP33118.1 efflux RND transporter periplasmic adaptor subunit [Ignavibacteriales bacterium]